MKKQEPKPKNGRDFLETYWQGIDAKSSKPVILTIDQLVTILDNYGKRITDTRTSVPISEEIERLWELFLLEYDKEISSGELKGKQSLKFKEYIKQALSLQGENQEKLLTDFFNWYDDDADIDQIIKDYPAQGGIASALAKEFLKSLPTPPKPK